jgi:very-short-patch-repair endonuclease
MASDHEKISFARRLRREATDAERLLWACLQRKQIGGAHFRRQAPIGPYIVDFVCHAYKLIIELDGGQHALPTHAASDLVQTKFLEGRGYTVLRFWNNQVMRNADGVVVATQEAIRNSER